MKILVTGGGGFVGKNLLRVMEEEGIEPRDITVLDQSQKDVDFVKQFGVKAICADLSVKNSIWIDAFKNQDIVVSLHAQISAPEETLFYKNNVEATKNVVEAAKIAGIRKIIHFSSAAVISVRKDHYAKTKQKSEEIVKSSGLKYVILRPSIMYGLFDNKNIGWLINFAKKLPFFPVPGNGKYPRQPIFVEDICRLVIKLIENFPEENKIYNINGRDIVYFRDMIKAVLKQMGGFRFPVYIPIPIFIFLVRVYDILLRSPFTIDQIKSLISGDVFPDYPWWDEFKIEITPFEKGVQKMLKKP